MFLIRDSGWALNSTTIVKPLRSTDQNILAPKNLEKFVSKIGGHRKKGGSLLFPSDVEQQGLPIDSRTRA